MRVRAAPLNEATLETLISEGGEYAELYYERRSNLDDGHELVALKKDVMRWTGIG